MASKQPKTPKPAAPARPKRAAPSTSKSTSSGQRQGPTVSHASDDTPLSSADTSDADPDTRRAPLDSPRPQVTRHI